MYLAKGVVYKTSQGMKQDLAQQRNFKHRSPLLWGVAIEIMKAWILNQWSVNCLSILEVHYRRQSFFYTH